MEEKINQEAIELVRHAMSLLDLKLYDDAIEILRKAIRLYQQINNEEELNSLRKKIAEIYTLKEEEIGEYREEVLINKEIEQKIPETTPPTTPEQLIEEAKTLVKINQFEEALSKYDNAIKILNENNRSSEVENVYKLIEQCYVAKARFLRTPEKEEGESEAIIKPEEIKQSSDLTKKTEVKMQMQDLEIETERLKVVEEKYKKEFADEEFQKKITDLADKADKMAREYESHKIRALKNGKFEEPCVYPDVIIMYDEARRLLIDRGWIEQAKIYTKQVQIYKEKLAKDIKIRELEAMKAEKDREYVDIMRTGKVVRELEKDSQREERFRSIEAKLKKEFEDEKFQNFITETVGNTEKMVRNYELEIKKGNFEAEPPYQRVLDIYTEIRQKLIDKGWMDQVDIYTNQIRIYNSRLEQDKKLRAVEAQKREKEKAYLDSLKIQKKEAVDVEKLKAVDAKYKGGIEEAKFQNLITSSVEEADKIEREYETKKKKAIREKKLLEIEAPYLKIIEIYERLRDMLLQKGWTDQATIYMSQIQVYTEKFERDKILRDIEAHKLQR